MRGRKKTLHDPVMISFWAEKSDKDAADATKISKAKIFHQGLKHCILAEKTRPEVINQLVAAEERMAEDHEAEADLHRHKAEEYRAKLNRNGSRPRAAEESGSS